MRWRPVMWSRGRGAGTERKKDDGPSNNCNRDAIASHISPSSGF
jgi:hypothetical protein